MHICGRYHETHRRESPPILALALDIEACAAQSGVSQALATMAAELEMHMFQEEMRLFPMMELGGNTLLWELIDAMRAEHLEQRDQIHWPQSGSGLLLVPNAAEMLRAEPRRSAGKMFANPIVHMDIEDQVLFERFGRRVRRKAKPP